MLAEFPEIFSSIVISEIRGVQDENNESPFYKNLAQHFFQMDFKRADFITLHTPLTDKTRNILDAAALARAWLGLGHARRSMGLPEYLAAIEQALFDRGRDRLDKTATKLVGEVTDEWASRGCTEPPGALTRRVFEARQQNQDAQASLSRDVLINAKQIEVENLRFTVTQGIALEQVLIGLHGATQDRALLAARTTVELEIALFNARVALFNADSQNYGIEAQVYRDRIQGELAKAEVYKAQIDGQRAIGEINKALVEQYEAQARSVLALVDIYKARVDAIKVRSEINVQRIEAKRAEVAVYGAQIDAYEAEWRGYAASVEARLGVVKGNEILVDSYLGRVNAWRSRRESSVEVLRAEVGVEDLKLRRFEARMRGFLGELEGQRTKLAAQANAAQARTAVYSAQGAMAQAQSAARDRAFQLNLEKGRTSAELQLKNAEIHVNQLVQLSAQILAKLQTIAQVSGQLAASSFSAVNLGASMSDSASNSSSCGTSISYSGEISDG